MLNFSNFVRTTLRSPATPSDTTLFLEAGSGALFALPAGDYCYVTVNDSTTVEVMKYTSIGPILNDTIPVQRGVDGTTAKAFPAGACVQVAWNKKQVSDFVTQLYNEMFNAAMLGSDTIHVTATPVSPPPGGVYYAVRVDTHQLWYWNLDGPGWIELGNISQGIVVTTSAPTSAPAPNVRFAIDTSTSTLYYWNNTAWLAISSSAASAGAEAFTRGTSNIVTINPGHAPLTSRDFAWAYYASWQANPALPTSITVDTNNRFKILHDALVVVSSGLNAEATTPGADCKGIFVLTSDDPTLIYGEWGGSWNFDPTMSSTAIVSNAVTTPVKLHAGSVIDINLILDSTSVSGIKVNKVLVGIEVIALQ
jgi:hypothetical protein